MVSQRKLSERELFLLTTPDDTEEAPWMTMPEYQWRVVALLMSILRLHVSRRGLRWHLAAELKVTMPRPGTARPLDVGPDLMMAEADDGERISWNVRAEQQPPAFVLEVVTEDSWQRDTEEKRLIYDAMGVREYALFAPKRRDGGPPLFGYRRGMKGRFVPWSIGPDDMLRSDVLDLHLYVEESKWLRVRDGTGRRLPSAEEEAARAEQEAAARHAEAMARQALELRLFGIEEELARLRALVKHSGDASPPREL